MQRALGVVAGVHQTLDGVRAVGTLSGRAAVGKPGGGEGATGDPGPCVPALTITLEAAGEVGAVGVGVAGGRVIDTLVDVHAEAIVIFIAFAAGAGCAGLRAVIAHLVGLPDPIAAEAGFVLTVRGAIIPRIVVPVVAALIGLGDRITAGAGDLPAVGGTIISIKCVVVIAGFSGLRADVTVSTGAKLLNTVCGAIIAVHGVSVITGLTGIQQVVSTCNEGAVESAGVLGGGGVVKTRVTGFVSFHLIVSAD